MSARTPEMVLFQKAKDVNAQLRSISYRHTDLSTDVAKELLRLNSYKSNTPNPFENLEEHRPHDPFTAVRHKLLSYQSELARNQDQEEMSKVYDLFLIINQYESLYRLANPDWKIGVNQGLFTSFIHALHGLDAKL